MRRRRGERQISNKAIKIRNQEDYELFIEASKRAEELDLSFSAYVRKLIRKDLREKLLS